MAKEFNIQDWQKKHLNERGFDDRLKKAGDFSDEEMDDITSRGGFVGGPFPGTDSSGPSKAKDLIDKLREDYRSMSDEELDAFSKEMIEHFLDNTAAQATAKAAIMIQLGKEAGPDPADDPHNQELPW